VAYGVMPVAGYLLGSVPFAFVIGKAKGVDIRTVGSKNVGATNLGRTLGKKYFWQAFLLDAAKGFLPVLVIALLVRYWEREGWMLNPGPGGFVNVWTKVPAWSPLITAVACVLGHNFPIWLGFKGGKGVATSFGVVLGFWPLYTIAGLLGAAFFVFMLMVYRYISLASMTAAVFFAIAVAVLGGWNNQWVDTYLVWDQRWPLIAVAGLFALMIVVRHRTNIGRLIKGTETKVGQRETEKAKLGH
jgi:glycerol-3-phosphate acyltransferase PlsY